MEKEIQKKQWITPTVELISSALIESGTTPARPEGQTFLSSAIVKTGSGTGS